MRIVGVNRFFQEIDDRFAQFENLVIDNLEKAGEEAVNACRTLDTYKDQTGNLRSSIGYVILKDGKIVRRGETKQFSGPTGNGGAGPAAAKAVLDKIAAGMPTGFTLIICAGMDYADEVENLHGLAVLTPGKLVAHDKIIELLTNI